MSVLGAQVQYLVNMTFESFREWTLDTANANTSKLELLRCSVICWTNWKMLFLCTRKHILPSFPRNMFFLHLWVLVVGWLCGGAKMVPDVMLTDVVGWSQMLADAAIPNAARCCQWLPDAARYSQILTNDHKGCMQMIPDAARPDAPRRSQMFPDAIRESQISPDFGWCDRYQHSCQYQWRHKCQYKRQRTQIKKPIPKHI